MNQITKTQYRFHPKVFKEPWKPYYDGYKGHIFIISHIMEEDSSGEHVWVECVDDPSVIVDGYVHLDELIKVR